MKIMVFVRRGVRLLVAPWRASSQSIWHLNVHHKRSLAHFLDFVHFYGSLTLVPQVRPVSSWRMG